MKTLGLALMVGGIGYTVLRFYQGMQHVTFNQQLAIFKTSGLLPCAAATGVGAYLYWK